MKAANDELEQDKLNGKLDNLKMEISSSDESSDSDSESESDDSETHGTTSTKPRSEKRRTRKAPYIEMVSFLSYLWFHLYHESSTSSQDKQH